MLHTSAMEREVRYCTTDDGVRIAYTVFGVGPPLLSCPAMVQSFSYQLPQATVLYDLLATKASLIRYDMRGTGLSDRDVDDLSGDAMTRDLEAVVRASGVDQLSIFATALSGFRAINFAVRHPDIVRHLVLLDTTADPHAYPRESARALGNLARQNWPLATQMFADMGTRSLYADAGQRQAISELSLAAAKQMEVTTSGDFVARLLEEAYESWSVVALLPEVRAKTLVLHQRDNVLFSLVYAQKLAAGIPDASLITLDGHDLGIALHPNRAEIVETIHRFMGIGAQPKSSDAPSAGTPGTAVILFTDIADSTAMTERLGDAAFRALSRSLDESVRAAIREHNGMPVEGKLLGDGVMGVFASAARAIDTARRCVELSADVEMPLHIGLHAGDVIHESGNVYGGAVNIASRICGLCEPGEILVSQTVRDLARTSAGVTFADRGEHELKGIADPVRVFAVRV